MTSKYLISILSVATTLGTCAAVEAQCPGMPVTVRGKVEGKIQRGDAVLLKFIYPNGRTETSVPEAVKGKHFAAFGAYSPFTSYDKKHGSHVCDTVPKETLVLLQDKKAQTLDSAKLTVPDDLGCCIEVNYGKKQIVVLHRPTLPRSD